MPEQLEYLNIERTQKFNAMKAIWRSFPFFFIFRLFSTSLFLLLEIRKSREAGEGWQNRKYNLLLKEVCPNMINFFEDIYHKVGRFSWDANSSRKSINPNFHSKSLSFLLQKKTFCESRKCCWRIHSTTSFLFVRNCFCPKKAKLLTHHLIFMWASR